MIGLIGSPSTARAQDALELARRRHAAGDTTLRDYRSRLNTLVSIGFINDPLAPPQMILASELASAVAWHHEQGLQIRMLGQRYATSDILGDDSDPTLDFGRPWFVTTAPGDSLRVLGGIEIPSRAALHPFARGADRYYRYTLGDTVILSTPERRVELIEVRVTPSRGDAALVVGSIWIDARTGAVGAMQIRFVGRPLWADEENPEGHRWANRILSVSATLQQGLWEGRYWLPHRQELELRVRIPLIGNFAVPVVFRSQFGRYRVNTGEPIAWISPDSLRTRPRQSGDRYAGTTIRVRVGEEPEPVEGSDTLRYGVFRERDVTQVRAGPAGDGWEIVRPPDDSLLAFTDWDRPLEAPASELTLPSTAALERRAQSLAPEIVGAGSFFIQYDRLPELIRYNRVEALGLGLAARWDIPRWPFWSLGGGVGFGVADVEFKARADLRYDAPLTRFELAGYSELHRAGTALNDDARAYGSPLRAFFIGRDDADYYRASGGALTLGRRWGRMSGRLRLGYEDHESVESNTDFAIPDIWEDSVFPPNPPATDGAFWRGDLQATVYVGDWTRPTDRAELTLGVELGSDADSLDYVQPRLDLRARFDLGRTAALALTARGGATAGEAPAQREWRIGGLDTVRGFLHGVRRGDSFWSAQLEVSPRRRAITPVVFADLGWAGRIERWPAGDSDEVLWSLGVGASFLWGIMRADLVFPEAEDIWFELYFAGAL